MAHHIPKIEYGGFIPTIVNFTYPPEQDGPEKLNAKQNVSVSLSGARQVSVDHVEASRQIRFKMLTESQLTALKTFYLNHAYLGKAFRYFDDNTSMSYTLYEMVNAFEPRRVAIAGENIYFYELTINLRRVVGAEEGLECMEATIANNQVAAADVMGLVLDSTLYRSVKVYFEIHRKTDSNEALANGFLTAISRDTGGWDITAGGSYDGDATGVSFSITAGGQVQYTSDNMTGANYEGTITFRDLRIC